MKIIVPFTEYQPLPCPDYLSEVEDSAEILGDLLGIIQDNFNCEFKNYYYTLNVYQNDKLKQWEITRLKK